MKSALKLAFLLGVLVTMGAVQAKADTLEYTLTEQGVSAPLATWTMSSTPTPDCPSQGLSPCYALGDFFGLDAQVFLNGSSTSTLETLVFHNTAASTTPFVVFNDANGSLPELVSTDPTLQLYIGSESGPEMLIPPGGSFTFGSDSAGFAGDTFTLSVVATPEPSTVLLLGAGLLGLVVFARRRQLAL